MESAIKLYSKLKKKGKTHRNVLYMNVKDVNEIEKSLDIRLNQIAKGNSDNEVIKKEMVDVLVNKMNCM